MDGNRRFAKKKKQKSSFGHQEGFKTLKKTLTYCVELGIKEVSVYAFSLDNFKRPKEEIDSLMELVEKAFNELIETNFLHNYGVKICILGNLTLFPPNIQQVLAKVMKETINNNIAKLNIYFGYTAREEIVYSIKQLAEGVENNIIEINDINEFLFSQCLYNDSIPDILVRTSGEIRLSDFMLWQISFSCIIFLKVFWPEFSFIHILFIILLYQKNYEKQQKYKRYYQEELKKYESSNEMNSLTFERQKKFLIEKDKQNLKMIENILNNKNSLI